MYEYAYVVVNAILFALILLSVHTTDIITHVTEFAWLNNIFAVALHVHASSDDYPISDETFAFFISPS